MLSRKYEMAGMVTITFRSVRVVNIPASLV